MTNKLITATFLQLIKILATSDLVARIRELVLMYWSDHRKGKDKKAEVTGILLELTDELGDVARDMAGWIISTAIDIVHAYLINRPHLTK